MERRAPTDLDRNQGASAHVTHSSHRRHRHPSGGTRGFGAGSGPAAKPDTAQPSTIDKVKGWTQKQWNATKAELQKDKAKWDSCNKRATAQHLSGRKSWSFIYDCMKS